MKRVKGESLKFGVAAGTFGWAIAILIGEFGDSGVAQLFSELVAIVSLLVLAVVGVAFVFD